MRPQALALAAASASDRLSPDRRPALCCGSPNQLRFGRVGPGSGGRLEICLNLPDAPVAGRLQPGGGMLARKVVIGAAMELDDELKAWLREAYERS